MGTRNLTAVVKDGEYKIAQYGQWDGYPEGQGATALKFLADGKLPALVAKLPEVRELSEAEYDEKTSGIGNGSGFVTMEEAAQMDTIFPIITRDHGANILNQIADAPEGTDLAVFLHQDFAKEGLFCEYAYVIDLDTNRFEAYVGFQRADHTDGRFAGLASEKDFKPEYQGARYYAPVRLAASWPLDSLPTEEVFAKTIDGVERYYQTQAEDYEPDDYSEHEPIEGPVIVDASLTITS